MRKRKSILWTYITRSHERQHGGCEARRMNPKNGQQRASPDVGQKNFKASGLDQIVQSGNYCNSSIRVASFDKIKKKANERWPWLWIKPYIQAASPLTWENNGYILMRLGGLAPVFENSATDLKLKSNPKLFRCKNTVHISTFNLWTLNRIGQFPELTTSAAIHNIDIACIQEDRNKKLEIQYHNTGNEWTLVSVFALENFVNAVTGEAGTLLNPRALKSINIIEKIQPKLMSSISKHSVQIIGRETNAQIGKDKTTEFCLHNSLNRNGEYLTDFSLKNRLTCLHTKFQKREEKLGAHSYPNNAKAWIDYKLINKNGINSALNCQTYSSF